MKLFFIVLGVLVIVMSAEVSFGEHETVVVDAWELNDGTNGQTLLHYKAVIDGHIVWGHCSPKEVTTKAELKKLVEGKVDELLSRVYGMPDIKKRPDLVDWEPASENQIDEKLMKAVIVLLIDQINVLKDKLGMPQITERQALDGIKGALKTNRAMRLDSGTVETRLE